MENNNFDNGFNSAEVQKPFTDKTADEPAYCQNTEQHAGASEPVFSQNTEQNTGAAEPVFSQNTEQHTGAGEPVFSQNTEQNTGAGETVFWHNTEQHMGESEPSNQFAPQNNTVQHSNYSQTYYTNASAPFNKGQQFNNNGYLGGNPYPQYNQGFNGRDYNNAGYNGQPPYIPYAPYPNFQQKPPKKKVSAGIVVIISVLCVLLAVGFVGTMAFVVSSVNKDKPQNDSDNGFSFTIPDYGSEMPSIPESTDPVVQHEESDYSDKINKDYKGLVLESKPKDASKNSAYNSEYAYNKVSSSVVGIVGYTDEVTTVEDCATQGSGIIISSDGYVVTNSHVIDNSKTSYILQVVTSDGKTYNAGVVGYDSRTDIAVLKMDGAENLKAAVFGDSNELELGEDIIAVGNPGGLDYQNSITKGVVSALDREMSSTSLVKYIQTDAAINPGNSGGPIVNLYGQVVGIATSKIVSEQYEGMGFAIPSDTAKEIIDALMRNGYVEGRVKIGIMGTNITSEMSQMYDIPMGIMISEITEDGPCGGTELEKGDIITGIDGNTVESFSDVYEILETYKPGDKVVINYFKSSDGSNGEAEIVLAEDK